MSTPPRFLQLAGHPLRWRLLSELARSDLRVGELCALAGERQNLVSYHLRQLRDGGLVTARRSSADGRDSYYVLDLARCREALANAGVALHPGLATRTRRHARSPHASCSCAPATAPARRWPKRCASTCPDGAIQAASAGSAPKPLHPGAVRVMRARGIDIAGRRSKHLDEFADVRFDRVISLCDRVREVCPEAQVHWSVPEPGDDDAFEAVAVELETRIGFLIEAINAGGTHA